MTTTAHDFSFKTIDGGALPLSSFKGKAVLVVNVASQCGLTPQYSGLEALWKEKGGKGLVVLGVPCNDFGAQEPGTENEIKTFCETRFSVDFPLTSKEHVIGGEAHPLYKWVTSELGEAATPKWNSTNISSTRTARLPARSARAPRPTTRHSTRPSTWR